MLSLLLNGVEVQAEEHWTLLTSLVPNQETVRALAGYFSRD